MAHTNDTLPITDIKVTVEGLLPKGGGFLATVFIMASVLTCVTFITVMAR